MGLQFTAYTQIGLFNVNSASPTFSAEAVTGLQLPTGALVGQRFYLGEEQANQLTAGVAAINGVTIQGHRGWYRTVQVDAGATAANVAFGYIGAQASLAKGVNVVTSADVALALGLNPCVFLGVVTPGNYTIVQDQGDATVYSTNAVTGGGGSGGTPHTVTYTSTHGQSADSGGSTLPIGLVGVPEQTTTGAGLVRVSLGFPFGVKAD
jgi:hypothetical protein